MKKRVLIVGAGGVGSVVAHKCAMDTETFQFIHLASRTLAKCDTIAKSVKELTGVDIETSALDADIVEDTIALLKRVKPDLLINVALPYQDLVLMDACLACGVHYMDTANYEPRDNPKFEYHWQWAYQERFKDAQLTALLGSGFDPGVTNIFTSWMLKHHFDEITEIDIIDVNGGDHGQSFATNFNPEINIREVTAPCRHWEDDRFVETPPLSNKLSFDCPEEVGSYNIYQMYHEEMESLVKHIPTIKRARFWMSFSESYLNHLTVLQNIGMTSIEPISHKGTEIIPLEFLKSLLPDPGTLGEHTNGRTCIGVIAKGVKDGVEKRVYTYNICDHEQCYNEVKSQAVSYTTGVPAMIGAKLLLNEIWNGAGVWNVEQFDPDPFMDALNVSGLPWKAQVLDPSEYSQFLN